MKKEDITETISRLRKYGFQLRLAQSIAESSPLDRQRYALQAAAALLFNVAVDAFKEEGNWESIDKHVAKIGLTSLTDKEGKRLGLNPIELASVNEAIAFGKVILEQAEAQHS